MNYQISREKKGQRRKGILLNLTEAEHAALKAACAEANVSVTWAVRCIVKRILEVEGQLAAEIPKEEKAATTATV